MKALKKTISIFLLLALLCSMFAGCATREPTETPGNTEPSQTESTAPEDTKPEETQPEETVPVTPVDITTTGGVVLVGTVMHDDDGWYLESQQPLNVTFHYFMDNPSTFDSLTRVCMFDPTIDGIEKLVYLGETVTIEGNFRFYRDDFEKLYILPYTITIGKTVPESYGAPDLQPPDLTQNRYDPSIPLPEQMNAIVKDGKYTYNPHMLSLESLELMGNDFAGFYCDFVDAFLNYESEVPCPDKEFAQMLSTIIFYEFPLYNYCAEPFEFVKHYDAEKKTVKILYKYDDAEHQQKVDQLISAANTFLSATSPDQSESELAKNIYHALCTRMTYDYSALEDIKRKDAYYAYIESSGVCVTFANVYNQLLTQVGIRATTAQCDYTQTMGHVWSLVTIDGQQYFCDPTFELEFKDGTAYAYFGQTYQQRRNDGLGEKGITAGRYYTYLMDESMLSATPIQF